MSTATHKKKKEKIGLVLTGGGMRCAYSAGALLALAEVHHCTEPYAIAAESGSAGNAFYYMAKQYDLARTVWLDYLTSERFIKSSMNIDIDYLIDTIFKKQVPLDTRMLERTKTKYFVPIANSSTGVVEFATNTSPYDYYEILRAAKALPIVYGKKVRLGLKTYIDGGMAETIQDLAQKILSTGVTSLITINCEPPRRDTLSKVFLRAEALKAKPGLRRALLKDLAIPPGLCPTNVSARAYCIQPSRPLAVKTLTRTKSAISDAFNLGYADVAESPELQALFGTTYEPHTRK